MNESHIKMIGFSSMQLTSVCVKNRRVIDSSVLAMLNFSKNPFIKFIYSSCKSRQGRNKYTLINGPERAT